MNPTNKPKFKKDDIVKISKPHQESPGDKYLEFKIIKPVWNDFNSQWNYKAIIILDNPVFTDSVGFKTVLDGNLVELKK